jgi:hypothetical protein
MAFLSGGVNSNRDQDVRRALAPLAKVAERTGTAVVIVRHLNKAAGVSPLYRGGGSIGIIGAARSGLVVGRHPEDESLRVLAGQKNNLSLPPESLLYKIETAENGSARISYEGKTEVNARQLLKPPADEGEKSAREEAKGFLLDALEAGRVPSKQIWKDSRDADIASATLKRAKAELGVKAEKVGQEWWWRLPEPEHAGGVHREGGDPLDAVDPLEETSRPRALASSCRAKGDQGDQGDHPNGDDPLATGKDDPFSEDDLLARAIKLRDKERL